MLNFEIIICTFGRRDLLNKTLETLASATSSRVKVHLIFNGEKKIPVFQSEKIDFKYYEAEKMIPGMARNIALPFLSKNLDYVLFLDDDVEVPTGYFLSAEKIAQHCSPDIFGGPDQASPMAPRQEQVISKLMGSRFFGFHTRFRHERIRDVLNASENHLSLCHLWVKPCYLTPFGADLFRNEETQLILTAKQNGAKICHFSDFFIYHRRRTEIARIVKNVFISGKTRFKILARNRIDIKQLLYLVPLLFFMACFGLLITKYYLVLPFLYLFVVLSYALEVASKANAINFIPMIAFLYLSVHLAYATGLVYGLCASIINAILIKPVSKEH